MKEQQLIIKLPCKPGSKVFIMENNASKCRDCNYYDLAETKLNELGGVQIEK